jgi:hypothetical protein
VTDALARDSPVPIAPITDPALDRLARQLSA